MEALKVSIREEVAAAYLEPSLLHMPTTMMV
jgi:hypothetical protein